MFRPQPLLRLRGLLLPLLVAAPLCAPAAFPRPQEEPPRAYTDEDLKPPRPAPPQPQSQPAPQLQPQPQAQPQPQTQPQARPQSRPVPLPGAGKPAVASAPPAQAGPQTTLAPAGLTAPAAPVASPPGGAPNWPGPDAWTQEWRKGEEDRAYWSEKARDAEDEIARLERRIDYLERKKASIQNPFLPRPLLTEEDRVAEEGLDGTARLARAEGQITEARQGLEKARRDLDKARALGGGQGAPPRAVGQSDKTN